MRLNFIKKIGIIILFCISNKLLSQNIGDYRFTNSVDSYSNLTGDSILFTTNSSYDNGITRAINISFPFKFGSSDYNYFKLSSNGWITFDTTTTRGDVIYPIANGSVGNLNLKQIIAGLSSDLTGSSNINTSYSILRYGTAPNRILKIQFKNVQCKDDNNANIFTTGSFQIWLYERSNIIEVRYGNFSSDQYGITNSQIGLRSSSTNLQDIRVLSGNGSTSWSNPTISNSKDSTLDFTNTILPNEGRIYSFIPTYSNDIEVTSIKYPIFSSIIIPDSTFQPKAVITNLGLNNQSNVFSIRCNIVGPGVSYNFSKEDTLSAGLSRTISFPDFSNSSIGTYSIKIYSELITDDNRHNDTLESTFNIIPVNSNYGNNGGTGSSLYYYANSAYTLGAPFYPTFQWVDTSGSNYIVLDGDTTGNMNKGLKFSGNLDDGYWKVSNIMSQKKFKFFGNDYSDSIFISTNGYVSFEKGYKNFLIDTIPSSSYPLSTIFGFGSDLRYDGDASAIPNRRIMSKTLNDSLLIITYLNAPIRVSNSVDPNAFISFQIILKYETTPTSNSSIILQYDDSQSGSKWLTDYYPNNTVNHIVELQNSDASASVLYRLVHDVQNPDPAGPIVSSPVAVEFRGEILTSNEIHSSQSPSEFNLFQNYPNPFNPTTNIKFSLSRESKVSLRIYDIMGREVQKLISNEVKKAGEYDIKFDGSNLSSGIYFYRLETEGFVDNKRMILLK